MGICDPCTENKKHVTKSDEPRNIVAAEEKSEESNSESYQVESPRAVAATSSVTAEAPEEAKIDTHASLEQQRLIKKVKRAENTAVEAMEEVLNPTMPELKVVDDKVYRIFQEG